MKTLIIILTMVLSFTAFSQEEEKYIVLDGKTDTPYNELDSNAKKVYTISELIEQDLDENYHQIVEKSKGLSNLVKQRYYYKHSKSPWVPFLLNALPGFGLGSLLQGNTVVGLIGMFGGITRLIYVYTNQKTIKTNYIFFNSTRRVFDGNKTIRDALWVPYFVNLIAPFIYSSFYNSKLEDALNINDDVSIDIIPTVGYLQNNQPVTQITLSVTF